MTEDQHSYQLLHPLTHPLFMFLGPQKDYELQLNHAVKGSKQRPNFTCVVDDTPSGNNIFMLFPPSL
ncbi:1098_t:CDS:1, partial [Paraglomus brasilianum]